MVPKVVVVLAALLCVWGPSTASGQPTHADLSSKLQSLMETVEEVGEDVEDLEDEIEDIADDIDENIEDELEDFEEGIRGELESVEQEVASLREEVKSLKGELETAQQKLGVTVEGNEEKLLSLQRDMNSTLYVLQELKEQLMGLRQEVQVDTGGPTEYLPSSCSELGPYITPGYYQLWDKSNKSATAQVCTGTSEERPAPSCKEVTERHPCAPSTNYWVRDALGSPVRVYCDMTRQSCSCGSPQGWMRVAHFNMTDPSQQCPSGFRLRTSPKRVCAKTRGEGCTSITFPAHSVQYSKVCGRVTAYQEASTDAFDLHGRLITAGIDGNYVDGVSITHGQSPRKHIWTFAATYSEERYRCPCHFPNNHFNAPLLPGFFNNDYFCEAGYAALWDGQGCGPTSSCCQFNSPPWFCKELPQPTTDNIEVRVCVDQPINDENVHLELIELFIQ